MKYLIAILAVLALCGSAEAVGRRQVVVQKQIVVQKRQRVQRVVVQQQVVHGHHAQAIVVQPFVAHHHVQQFVAPVYSQQFVAPVVGGCHSGSLQLNGGGCSAFLRGY